MGIHRGVQRVPLKEAAQLLGVSKDAVGQRISRGTIRSDKGEDGRVYVYVDASPDDVHDDAVSATSSDPRDQLIEQLRSEVEAWRGESRRKDHIIAGLVERLPPQLEPPRDEPESPTEAAGGAERESKDTGPLLAVRWLGAMMQFCLPASGALVEGPFGF